MRLLSDYNDFSFREINAFHAYSADRNPKRKSYVLFLGCDPMWYSEST